ncbi:MAG TPA: PsiF family protein [Steroidobacteraceae bacterium]
MSAILGSMSLCFRTVAAAVCFCLPVAGVLAAPPVLRADVPGAAIPGTAEPGAAAAPAGSPAATPPAGDAAAKHAKRTACLKDAKAKKLVGAEKTAFLKNCIAPP